MNTLNLSLSAGDKVEDLENSREITKKYPVKNSKGAGR